MHPDQMQQDNQIPDLPPNDHHYQTQVNSNQNLELSSLQGKVTFLEEKNRKVQEMHDATKRDYQEQKKFYEDALEARTKQLDEMEQELNTLKQERDGIK